MSSSGRNKTDRSISRLSSTRPRSRSLRHIDLTNRNQQAPATPAATKPATLKFKQCEKDVGKSSSSKKLSIRRSSFDLDDDPLADEGNSVQPSLDWRLDPEKSLSDWTIIISDGSESTTYHVHKNVLGVGPRSSKYFSTLFTTQMETVEMAASTSSIVLEPSAAAGFPVLLDYMYKGEGSIEITTSNAVALRFLTKYFGVRSLYVISTDHIRQTLTPKRAPIYLAEAGIHNDDLLIEAATQVCAENMEHIFVGLFASLPPELFRRVVLSSSLKCGSKCLSKVVANYCRTNRSEVDLEFLMDVTDEALMPTIIAEEGPFLLCMCMAAEEASGRGMNGESGKGGQRTCPEAAADRLSSLRQRCIEASSLAWDDHLARPLAFEGSDNCRKADRRLSAEDSVRSHREIWHRSLPLPMQVELLEASLVRAHVDVEDADARSAPGSMKRIKSKDDEVRDLRDAITKKDKEIEELHKVVRAFIGRRNSGSN